MIQLVFEKNEMSYYFWCYFFVGWCEEWCQEKQFVLFFLSVGGFLGNILSK